MKKIVSSLLAVTVLFFGGLCHVFAGGNSDFNIAVIKNDAVDITAFWEGINSVLGVTSDTPHDSQRTIKYVSTKGEYSGQYTMNFIEVPIQFTEVLNLQSNVFRNQPWDAYGLVMVTYDSTNEPDIGWEQFMLKYTEFVKQNDKHALLMFVPINSEHIDDIQRNWLANFVGRAENAWLREHPHKGKELPQFISNIPGYKSENVLNQIVREFLKRKKKTFFTSSCFIQ